MYYIEQWLDGKLMCKSTPNGKWREVNIQTYRSRLQELENKVNGLETDKTLNILSNLH